MSNFQRTSNSLFVFGDIINLCLAFYISVYFYKVKDVDFQGSETLILGSLIFLWLIIGYSNRLYAEGRGENILTVRMGKYLKAYFILAGIIGMIYMIFSFPTEIRNLILALLVGFPILGSITNLIMVKVYRPLQEKKNKFKSTLIAGEGYLAKKVEDFMLSNPFEGDSLQGFVLCNAENSLIKKDRVVTTLENLNDYLNKNYVSEIIIALSFREIDSIKSIVKVADYHGARVRFVPDYESIFGGSFKSYHFGDLEMVNVRQLPLDEWFPNLQKTSFDIVFSTFALLFLSPLFLLIATLIKMESKGPVFYCPQRIGKGGKPFKVFKFRTMFQNDNSQGGTMSTVKDDPRITRVGKFLRKYSLDELPQFMNVLTGEMSVIGPRPHRTYLNQLMQASEENYMVRHYYRPGITGWAQVNGWRGPLETCEQKKQRTQHDLWYLNNWSFWLDLRIIYKTIFSAKTHKSAF
ncbi:exopolysaccharide biosynthesis polyprenyl glycosylphosphotransferase [Rhodonellum sp.]|uniref:exopolysaccharide biosynthesis polyprenyl glycosylphosphotransferase n=1 Tax=Rhodonellum sp. TaxID=2231180 RepID=UPI0027254829|nr:exopolysaccharide biosynthesis polyprenyl glycosylphosphotransferase [Rhodonellum sp.]MDO9554497.1 exopolysaccharide biosynthesis polyprenyl glycosylphosphotransferase [Rhodonellum sp.]